MEDKIREYEVFIEKKTSEPIGPIERVKLAEYHKEMVQNFQHERLIHLIVMFFFVSVALGLIGIFAYEVAIFGLIVEMLPFYILTALVTILSGAYVKHYYFLENHVQGLYKYNKILRLKDEKKED
ncbi:hypothetical protein J6X90_03220 [Candidatus Saccharibacteria bacterium]|nr:hypothetical protein [Candidatus Saccharibacteria bacterium]